MRDKIQWEYDIKEARKMAYRNFEGKLYEANRIWHNLIQLIITLSVPLLVLSIALAGKLTSTVLGQSGGLIFLILGWIFLSSAIICGVIQKLKAAIFYNNQAMELAKILKDYDKKLALGETKAKACQDDKTKYTVSSSIRFGVFSIDSFLFALICLCIALLQKVFAELNIWLIGVIFTVSCVLLVVANVSLLKAKKGEK